MSSPATTTDEAGHGLRIARVAGIPVYLTPSWFLIAAVIVAIVAGPVLDSDPLLGLGVGVLQALLLLVSVLAHEAAHALAAQALGMPVVRIVANLWGGHTSYQALRPAPGRMAVIALAGPAANVVLALAALVVRAGLTGDLARGVAEGMILINASLAAFNVIPALPLDGGQVVESLVWKATGDRNRGSLVAGWAGRVLAVAGVAWFVVRPLLQGQRPGFELVWALVIASVVWSGATSAIRRATALTTLGRLRVQDVAEAAVLLPPETPLGVAVDHPSLVVTPDERGLPVLLLLGTGDAIQLDRSAPLAAAVSRIPDANVVEAAPGDDLEDVVAAMGGSGFGTVVLTEGGRVWGLTSADRINGAARRN